jgi:polyhydroxyalkanoate synthesis regulator phasin
MPSIYYEKRDGDVYQIDEVSQRLLVYVYLHGSVEEEDVVDPISAENKHAIRSRIESQLGEDAAQLVEMGESYQQTLGDRPDDVILSLVLTETGEEFVKKHRSDLSMPVEIAELAKRVSELQVGSNSVEELRHRVEILEERVQELEE